MPPKHTPAPTRRPPLDALLSLPRIVRLVMIALPALATVILIQPLVDEVYLNNFYDDSTRLLPSLVIAFAALGVYFFGWVAFVGPPGEAPTQHRRTAALYLLTATLLILAALVYLLTQVANNPDLFT